MKIQFIRFFLNLFYPERCPICDRVLSLTELKLGVCDACIEKVSLIDGPRCYICGKKLGFVEKEYCDDCKKRKHFFDRGLALFQYDDSIKKSLYRLKYGGRYEYGAFYGKLMARKFGTAILRAKADCIIAVPLHKKREEKRGYNQAEAIAKALSKEIGIPYKSKVVVRKINTKPLKLMTPFERQNNLKNAFKIGRNDVKSKVTVVIDDIYTTGSTMDAIARLLKASGVQKVYFISVAIGEDGG